MATPAGELKVFITASLEGLRKGIEDARAALNAAGPKLKRAAAVVGGAIAAGIGLSLHAFAEAEKAAKGLEQALKNQGITSKAVRDEILEYSDALASMTGVSDEAITEAQTLFVRMGLSGQALRSATQAALDLSTRTGDVTSAAQLLANAVNGETERLKKFGVVIEEGTPKAAKFAEALRQIRQIYGGAAAAEADTLAGAFSRLREFLDKIAENVGEKLAPAVRQIIEDILANKDTILQWVQDISSAIAGWLRDLLEVLKFLREAWPQMKEAIKTVSGIAFRTVTAPFRVGRAAVQDGVNAITGGATPPTKEDLLPKITITASRLKKGEAGGGKPAEDGPGAFALAWQDAFQKTFRAAGQLTADLQTMMGGIVSTLSTSFQEVFVGLAEGAASFQQVIHNLGLGIRNAMFKLIADILARQLAAIAMAGVASLAHTVKEIVMATAVGKAWILAAEAKKGWIGLVIGAAAVAAFAVMIANVSKFKDGGWVKGSGGEDSVPAMLTPGELVLNKRQQQALFGGAGGGHTFILQGPFYGTDETQVERWVRRTIIPLLDDYSLKTRGDRPFKAT
ncbi:MAG: hypothetical protein HY554_07495 [Elusimicrobia bacterium]|nr:hypothetical protein [Elusimicrobiota bacterium]